MTQHIVYEGIRSYQKRSIKAALVIGIIFLILGMLGFLAGDKYFGYGLTIFGGFSLFCWLIAKAFVKLGL